MGEDLTLSELAATCVLEMANSNEPGVVLASYFHKAFNLGVQDGLRRTTESLDKMAGASR